MEGRQECTELATNLVHVSWLKHYLCRRPTYQFSRAELFKQLDSKKLTNQRPCVACAAVARVQGDLLVELQAICHQSV